MTDVVHIDARFLAQLVLCSALLSAFAFVAFRSNAVTRRAYALIAGMVLTALPFALAMTSGWHWTAAFEVLTLVSLAGSVPIPVWLIAIWASVAFALNLQGLYRLVDTRRRLAAMPRVDDAGITAEAAVVARRLAYGRPYQLHFGPNSCSSTLAGNRIVLRADARDWEPRAVRAVLAHEFVHLSRRDDLCLFVLGLVLNWYWFAPWVGLLRRQYASAMEQSCDDRAAEILPSCADYLDGVLCAARAEQEPLPIVAAMGGAGVVARFQRFLGSRQRQLDVGGVYWGLVVGLGAALLFTSVEFEAYEPAPVLSIGTFPGPRTLTLEHELALPTVHEHALGEDRPVRRAPPPIYPGGAINEGIEGHVVVEYKVSRDGRVVNPVVVDSDPPGVFDRVALRAVARREYVSSHELANAGSPNPPDRIVRRFDFDIPAREPRSLSDLARQRQFRRSPGVVGAGAGRRASEAFGGAGPNLPVTSVHPPPTLPPADTPLPQQLSEQRAVPVNADALKPVVPRIVAQIVDPGLAIPAIDKGDLLPVIKVAPIYPKDAIARNVTGQVLLEFVVTETGAVRDPVVLAADPPGVFERAAIDAVGKFRYSPKVVEGKAVEVTGVRNRIVFEIADQ